MKKFFISLLLPVFLLFFVTGCTDNKESTNSAKDNTNNDKSEKKSIKAELSFGKTITFDGFEITFHDNYTFTRIDNTYSEKHDNDVVIIPATVKNVSDETGSLNMFYQQFFGSKGTKIDEEGIWFDDFRGLSVDLRSGAQMDVKLYLSYDGDGDYFIEFDNYTDKVEVKLPIKK